MHRRSKRTPGRAPPEKRAVLHADRRSGMPLRWPMLRNPNTCSSTRSPARSQDRIGFGPINLRRAPRRSFEEHRSRARTVPARSCGRARTCSVRSAILRSSNSWCIRAQMRCAVCRCLRGAFRSASRIASTNSIAALSFHLGRAGFFRGFGNALPIASRTIRRCTASFLATPMIVPIPNSYSRRMFESSPTSPTVRAMPEYPFAKEVDQNKPPNWTSSEYRNQGSGRLKRLPSNGCYHAPLPRHAGPKYGCLRQEP